MTSTVLRSLFAISAALEQASVPPLSQYWQAQARKFYAHDAARLLVECVGRGGDKSRTSVMMAIAEVLAGDFVVPPGERHYFTHISESKDEATKTLGVLEQYLRILSVEYTRSGETIELLAVPRGFKVLAARVGAVSGWRCIGWTADECAKWSNDGADPSAEVIASIKAMTVTHPNARGRMFSSPLGDQGFFFETWSAGDGVHQVTGHAASWEANPSITEEQTHKLEPIERVWAREYKAVASGASSRIWSPEFVDPCFTHDPKLLTQISNAVLLIDFAGSTGADGIARLTGDDAVALFAFWSEPESDEKLWLYDADGKRQFDAFGAPLINPRYEAQNDPVLTIRGITTYEKGCRLRASEMVAELAALAHHKGVHTALGDERESYSLHSLFAQNGIAFHAFPTSTASKHDSVKMLTRLMREKRLSITPHTRMQQQMLRFRERILPSGLITYGGGKGAGVDDHVSALLLAARAEVGGHLAGSPAQAHRRTVVEDGVGWGTPQKAG